MADRQDADVFEEVQAFNDHGKVLAGVHENFLAVRFNDPTLCKVRYAAPTLDTEQRTGPRTPWKSNPMLYSTHTRAFVRGSRVWWR